jgi:branched-chain amino acid transport system substrate-binding protein
VTETRIPWLLHNFPDDRQQGYTLADYVFKNLKLKRIGIVRTQTRYARIGVAKFSDEARRMGRQPVLEVKFERGDQDFSRQLGMLRDAQLEGVVIWGEAAEAGLILKQMREMGMKQPVFGSSRLAYPQLLAIAGPAAEGLVVTSPLNPARTDSPWVAFLDAYRQKYHEDPIDYAAYAYDGMNMLMAAIEKAGLNRGRIMDVLRDYQMKTYQGVTGPVYFDHTLNNLAPVNLARVKDGKFDYWLAPRQHGHEGAAAVPPSPPATPYARIDRDAVNYSGPGRDAGHDVAGTEARIGLLLPLTGPRQVEGEALRRAAQMAVDDENAAALPGRNRLLIVARDESGPWGQASTEIVRMVFDDQVVALITSAEGGSAHLAEQVGNKIGVPVLTLSTDSTTTEINLPWIFRMGPSDAAQARAFAREIYQNRKLQPVVLLLTQDDRDGRLGGAEFAKAARAMNAVAPARIVVGPENLTEETIGKELATAQAVVIWSDTATASRLIARVRELRPTVPIYLCRKAAAGDSNGETRLLCPACGEKDAGQWIASAPENRELWADFYRRYRQSFGAEPGIGAAEAYDAVRLLAVSLRQSGPNRARLRDALAGVSAFAGASGVISFDHAGNDHTQLTLLKHR